MPSIRIAIDDLRQDRVAVVYPGAKRHPVGDKVEGVPLAALATPGSLFASALGQAQGPA